MVTLESTGIFPVTISLDHAVYCGSGSCSCDNREFLRAAYNPKTGEVGTRIVPKGVYASRVLRRGEPAEFRDDVLNLLSVKSMLKRGLLRIVAQGAKRGSGGKTAEVKGTQRSGAPASDTSEE